MTDQIEKLKEELKTEKEKYESIYQENNAEYEKLKKEYLEKERHREEQNSKKGGQSHGKTSSRDLYKDSRYGPKSSAVNGSHTYASSS